MKSSLRTLALAIAFSVSIGELAFAQPLLGQFPGGTAEFFEGELIGEDFDPLSVLTSTREELRQFEVGEKVGIMNREGSIVIPAQFDEVGQFSEGRFAVRRGLKWGFVDAAGRTVIECQYEECQAFGEGLANFKDQGLWGVLDLAGREIVTAKFEYIGAFASGLAPAKLPESKLGFINREGTFVIPAAFDVVDPFFSEGLAAVCRDGKWGYIDLTGKETIPLRYESAEHFSQQRAAVKDGQWGFIDPQGHVVIECKYKRTLPFSEGLACVQVDKLWGFVNASGRFVIPPSFFNGGYFKNGVVELLQRDGTTVRTITVDYAGNVREAPSEISEPTYRLAAPAAAPAGAEPKERDTAADKGD